MSAEMTGRVDRAISPAIQSPARRPELGAPAPAKLARRLAQQCPRALEYRGTRFALPFDLVDGRSDARVVRGLRFVRGA